MGEKKLIPARVDTDIQDKLKIEADEENRTFSNHVETVLKRHVEKKELPKPYVSKKEYGGK